MKAALIHRYSGNEQVQVAEVGVPALGDTDLLVQVHAGSGGVGTLAIQMAHDLGAMVQ